jgi:hypothetical protein
MKTRLVLALACAALSAGCGVSVPVSSGPATPAPTATTAASPQAVPAGPTCLQFTQAADGIYDMGGAPDAWASSVLTTLIQGNKLTGQPETTQVTAFFADLRTACADPSVSDKPAATVAETVYRTASEKYRPKS